MSRITEVFSYLKAENKKALIVYITAGDPSLAASKEIIVELIRSGADILELGVPFSDPTADGPIIQAASQRALKNGTNLVNTLDLVKEIRHVSRIPIILFGYYNPFFVFGPRELCRRAKEAGVDGLLVVDLPYEEADELKQYSDQTGLDLIFLLAPTSNTDRIKMISRKGRGFLYYVSMTGTTGSQQSFDHYAEKRIELIKDFADLPVVIGFGISTPKQAHDMARLCDGVVVGSAIVRIIGENHNSIALPKMVGEFTAQLRQVV